MRLNRPRKLCLVAILALFSDALPAGEAPVPAEQEDPARIETITVTASRRARPIREVANSVSVIDAERMRETMVDDIKDLVRYTPWLSVSNDPSRFGAAGFTIRGIDANRVAIEIDGVPVADSFGVGSYSSARRDVVNPAMLRRVEILRGPASALYGSDAIGGVVSYTTWQPRDLLARTRRNWAMDVTTGYGSSDDGLSTSVSAAAGGEHLQGLVIASVQNGSEVENTAETPGTRPNPRDSNKSDLFTRIIRSGKRGALGLTMELRHARARTEINNLEGQGRFASTTRLSGDDRQTRKRLTIDGEFNNKSRLADNSDWQVYYQESVTDQRTVEDRAASARAPAPTRRLPSFEFSQRTIGAEFSATRQLERPRASHRLLYGAQFRISDAWELRDNLLIDLDDGSETKTVLGENFPVRDFPESRINEAAIFAHDEILLANKKLTLIPAIRVEYYELDPRPDSIYREDNPLGEAVSLKEISLSPKLGLVYHLSARASIFAQYARGFRSPPFEDANIGLDIPLFNIRAVPNPDLTHETSDGFEIGLRLLGSRLTGSLSAFNNDYDDFIETKVNLGPDPETGVLIFQSQNRERARIYGTELELAYDLRDWIQGLTLNGSLAMTRGEDRSRNVPLNSVDTDRAVAGLRYDRPNQSWGAELLASFAAKKTRVDESAVDFFQPPGYGVLDLLAYFRISDSTTLNAGLFNLTNKRFWDWADVRGRPANDPLIDLYTRPGFNFSASLRLEW